MAKLKHPIRCKALTKPPKDRSRHLSRGGLFQTNQYENKVYSFDLTKVDALFDEMLLQKAIETPHGMPKPKKSSKAGGIADGTTLGTILPTGEPELFGEKSGKIGLRKMKRNG
ncbi:unnamed protein product [Prunus brigantina]